MALLEWGFGIQILIDKSERKKIRYFTIYYTYRKLRGKVRVVEDAKKLPIIRAAAHATRASKREGMSPHDKDTEILVMTGAKRVTGVSMNAPSGVAEDTLDQDFVEMIAGDNLLSKAMEAEEARLAVELEKEAEAELERERADAKAKGELSLSTDRVSKLGHLLDQTAKFTEFLSGKLSTTEEREEREAEEESLEGQKNGKRTRRGSIGASDSDKKKARTESDSSADSAATFGLGEGVMLRRYQVLGIRWLASLYENGINGILADEMGLGKTVQTIGLLAFLRKRGVWGPVLVLGPLSTLSNWMNEISKFAPHLPAVLYHGSKEERDAIRSERLRSMPLLSSSRRPLLTDFLRPLRKAKNATEKNAFQEEAAANRSRAEIELKVALEKWESPDALKARKKAERQAFNEWKWDFPIVVTSYEIMMRDRKELQRIISNPLVGSWTYVVVDEGHRLKNWQCKLFKELSALPAQNRLLLSGTPLQNNLAELWSLLHFILPDVFTSLENFERWFDFDGEGTGAEQRSQIVQKLHTLLKPFLLRRLKSDVEANLAEKTEIVLYAGMSELQKRYYTAMRDRTLDAVLNEDRLRDGIPSADGKAPAPVRLLNILMQMRKCCNHPYLVDQGTGMRGSLMDYRTDPELLEHSGKLQLLDRLLVRLKRRGNKVLIFSQMTRMLDLIEDFLSQRRFSNCRIDGSVPWQERKEAMDHFNTSSADDAFVFLLSTRAGGLGINLVSADTVIIFDSDWNPHADLQAMDRCHRIGQTKEVHVYRLTTIGSVESQILKRASQKLELERMIIHKGGFKGRLKPIDEDKDIKLTSEDVVALLRAEVENSDESSKVEHNRTPERNVISDEDLDRIMESRAVGAITNAKEASDAKKLRPPFVGPGFEEVLKVQNNFLSGIS